MVVHLCAGNAQLFKQGKLSGKTVYPFATNGGWIGHTFEDFAAALPDCTVEKGLNVHFDESTLRTSQAAITAWAKQICE